MADEQTCIHMNPKRTNSGNKYFGYRCPILQGHKTNPREKIRVDAMAGPERQRCESYRIRYYALWTVFASPHYTLPAPPPFHKKIRRVRHGLDLRPINIDEINIS